MKKLLAIPVLLMLSTTGLAVGQEEPATFAGEVQVVEVLLDVLVTDKDGNVILGLEPGDFIMSLGDAHIYLNHLEQVDTQLSRETFPLPVMQINPDRKNLFEFEYDDFDLQNYQCHAGIRAPISV